MLPIGSFLALIVMPSASDAISRTMSVTSRSACPGSRSWMNQAFSAKRQASRNSRLPYASHTSRTARRLASDTGCPPPLLLVIVMNTTGTSSPRSRSNASSASMSMLPLNGWSACGSRPCAMTRSTACAPVYSTLARVVSKCVLFGTTFPGPREDAEEDPLGRPALVGGDHVLEREQLAHGVPEHVVRRRAGVGLVAVLDRGPLVAAHRAGARVGEQVDQHVLRVHLEQVVTGLGHGRLALLPASSSAAAPPSGSGTAR